jgi:hypothetical protein
MAATRLAVELLAMITRPEHAVITKTLEGYLIFFISIEYKKMICLEWKHKYLNRNLMLGMMY